MKRPMKRPMKVCSYLKTLKKNTLPLYLSIRKFFPSGKAFLSRYCTCALWGEVPDP